MGIFSDVAYTLSSSLRVNDQKHLSDILDLNGATRSPLEDVTHIISDTPEFEGWQSAPENAEVVTVSGHGLHPTISPDICVAQMGRAIHCAWKAPDVRYKHLTCGRRWLTSSARPKYYSADPSMLFSGVCACATDASG